jgi:hypothetical protein
MADFSNEDFQQFYDQDFMTRLYSEWERIKNTNFANEGEKYFEIGKKIIHPYDIVNRKMRENNDFVDFKDLKDIDLMKNTRDEITNVLKQTDKDLRNNYHMYQGHSKPPRDTEGVAIENFNPYENGSYVSGSFEEALNDLNNRKITIGDEEYLFRSSAGFNEDSGKYEFKLNFDPLNEAALKDYQYKSSSGLFTYDTNNLDEVNEQVNNILDFFDNVEVGDVVDLSSTSEQRQFSKEARKRIAEYKKNNPNHNVFSTKEDFMDFMNKAKNRNTNTTKIDSEAIEQFKTLSDEEIANFSDTDLSDWADTGDDFNRALELREQARQRLKNNAGSQQAETNVEPNNPESVPQEAPQDVEETIETHSDNTDTSTVEHTNKLDADDIVDPIEPEFRHNTVETKPRQRVKGRRKQSVDTPKTSKGRGKAKGSTTKTFTKGRNLAKGAGQAVAGKVLGEAAEQTSKVVDDVIEEGLDNVDDVIKAVEPDFTKPPVDAIEPEFNPDPLDTKAEVKKPQGEAKPDDNLKVDTDSAFDTTPTHGVEPVFDLGDEVDDEALKMLQEGAEGSISAIGRVANIGMNTFGAIGAYKDARRKGHGVVSSAVRAGIDFAVGEMLGPIGYMAVQGAYYAGKGVIKGTEALYKENRRMNSAANQQVFGDTQFQDTQQLATMRQSGMEMAKMAQYNLQQTLMGNEATHLHR